MVKTCCCKMKVIMKLIKNPSGMLICLFNILATEIKSFNYFKMFYRDINKIDQIKPNYQKKLKYVFGLRATFTCSWATKFSFAGRMPFIKKTCSRAKELPFAGCNWPAGRSLSTPELVQQVKRQLKTF